MMAFTIPVPPSANRLWRHNRGRTHRSPAYERWRDQAAMLIKIGRKGQVVDGPAVVSISLRRPRANADLDNRAKPVLDALQHGGALADDKQVTLLTLAWANHDDCKVTVGEDVH